MSWLAIGGIAFAVLCVVGAMVIGLLAVAVSLGK